MKRKYIAATIGIMMSLAMVTSGCSGAAGTTGTGSASNTTQSAVEASQDVKTEAVKASDYAGQTVSGSISNIDGQNITILLREDKSGSGAEGESESETVRKEMTITVSDSTVITASRGHGGMGGGMKDGGAPRNDGTQKSDGTGKGNGTGKGGTTQLSAEVSLTDEDDQSAQRGGSKEGNRKEAEEETLTISDLSVGMDVSVSIGEDGNVTALKVNKGFGSSGGQTPPEMPDGQTPPDGQGGPGGQSTGVESYDAATEYTSNTSDSGQTIASTEADENAIHAYNGAAVTLSDMTITRESESSTGGDNASFYGVGAAVLETDGTLYLKESKVTTNAKGGAGVFAYGDGTAYVADTTISTAQSASGGIHVAGGGTLYAYDVTAETQGASSAAIRSDRGGGTMVVDGGSFTSNGSGSPAIYSTADITVNNAKLTANGAEAICIEGLNSIRLYDCELSGNMPDSDQNDCTWNVILYQSMSGDSEVGNSTFEMDGGVLTAENGGMFYTTNTESTFVLKDVEINYADENDFFLKATGNSNQRGWGSAGANGADCLFTAISQEMEGDVIWDSISELDLYMTDGSTLTGAVIDDESNAGSSGSGTGSGYCSLYISEDSKWVVTGDSVLTNLYCAGEIVDADGKTVTVKGTDGTVYVTGSSSYTITVSSYAETADLSGASAATAWSDYAVEKPAALE